MVTRLRQFPRLRQAPSYQNHAAVYAIALLLSAIVGTCLFFGSAQVITQTEFGTRLGATARANGTVIRRSTPGVAPTPTAGTPVSFLASLPIGPTSVTTTVATAVATTATSIFAATPSPPLPARFLLAHVGNTQGDGVFLRHTPRLSDRWIAWVDHTPLVMLGVEQDGDGQHWLQVRDPKNDVGWVPAQFVTQ
jgi:hypothetical protein